MNSVLGTSDGRSIVKYREDKSNSKGLCKIRIIKFLLPPFNYSPRTKYDQKILVWGPKERQDRLLELFYPIFTRVILQTLIIQLLTLQTFFALPLPRANSPRIWSIAAAICGELFNPTSAGLAERENSHRGFPFLRPALPFALSNRYVLRCFVAAGGLRVLNGTGHTQGPFPNVSSSSTAEVSASVGHDDIAGFGGSASIILGNTPKKNVINMPLFRCQCDTIKCQKISDTTFLFLTFNSITLTPKQWHIDDVFFLPLFWCHFDTFENITFWCQTDTTH